MRKILSIILLTVMLLTVFTSCNDNETTVEVDADGYVVVNGVKTEYRVSQDVSNEIHYPLLKSDKKIESLPLELQGKIDAYVADCKTIYTASYVSVFLKNLKNYTENYTYHSPILLCMILARWMRAV